jgi:hypothetical protein
MRPSRIESIRGKKYTMVVFFYDYFSNRWIIQFQEKFEAFDQAKALFQKAAK